jgi:hypothetical protein
MIVLITSAGREMYKQFILQVLCYPNEYVLPDVPYGLDRVAEPFAHSATDLSGQLAVVVLVAYKDNNGVPEAQFYPLRLARIVKSRIIAGKLLVDLRLGLFPYYEDGIQTAYRDPGVTIDTGKKWSRVLCQKRDAPVATARPGKTMQFADPASWRSDGKFVFSIADNDLDFNIDKAAEVAVRYHRDDWKSVIDMIAPSSQLKDKLFYQISVLSGRAEKTDKRLTEYGSKTIYDLQSGDSADLFVHFYFGGGHGHSREEGKRVLEISTDRSYVATIGRSSIDVYPQQFEGKIESIQLIAKKQMSEEFTRLAIREKDGVAGFPALATAELYLRIRPKPALIWVVLTLFFVGALLSALAIDLPLPSPLNSIGSKVVGSIMMAIAFYLGFAKFPSGAG